MKTLFRAEQASFPVAKRWILLLSALLFINGWVDAATLRDLIQHTRRLLGDTPYYNSVPKVTDQKIISFLNEGQHFAAVYSWAFMQRVEFSLTAGTTEYALPADYQAIRRVTLSNAILAERTLDALDGEGSKWIEAAGQPQYYYTWTTTFTVIGFNPAPNLSTYGNVQVDYISQIRDMSSYTDLPFNGIAEFFPLHESLAKFAAYRFYLLLGNLELAKIHAGDFAADVKKMAEIMVSRPNYRPGFEPSRQ